MHDLRPKALHLRLYAAEGPSFDRPDICNALESLKDVRQFRSTQNVVACPAVTIAPLSHHKVHHLNHLLYSTSATSVRPGSLVALCKQPTRPRGAKTKRYTHDRFFLAYM